jgi:hypothetical protein
MRGGWLAARHDLTEATWANETLGPTHKIDVGSIEDFVRQLGPSQGFTGRSKVKLNCPRSYRVYRASTNCPLAWGLGSVQARSCTDDPEHPAWTRPTNPMHPHHASKIQDNRPARDDIDDRPRGLGFSWLAARGSMEPVTADKEKLNWCRFKLSSIYGTRAPEVRGSHTAGRWKSTLSNFRSTGPIIQ